jgi:hypothetical protein
MSSDTPKKARAEFVQFDGELWLARRLSRHGPLVEQLFSGVTNAADRKRVLRQAITMRDLQEVIVGRKDGKCFTYSAAFARLYGEPL